MYFLELGYQLNQLFSKVLATVLDFVLSMGITSDKLTNASMQVTALNLYLKLLMVFFHGLIISTWTSFQGLRCWTFSGVDAHIGND